MPATIELMKAKSEKGMRTRQKILDAAVHLIQQRGVRSTSVDDVLKASGTGKSQFYHYFGSKDLMVREVIAAQARGLPTDHEKILAGMRSIADVESWLEAMISAFDRGLYPNGCPIGTLASELASTNEEHRTKLAKTFEAWESALAKGIRSMRSRNILPLEAEPESLAMFIVSSIEGAFLLAKTDRSSVPLETAKDHILRYLRSFKPSNGRAAGKKLMGFCP